MNGSLIFFFCLASMLQIALSIKRDYIFKTAAIIFFLLKCLLTASLLQETAAFLSPFDFFCPLLEVTALKWAHVWDGHIIWLLTHIIPTWTDPGYRDWDSCWCNTVIPDRPQPQTQLHPVLSFPTPLPKHSCFLSSYAPSHEISIFANSQG